MSKASPPEFTDYKSAEAFIKAGRDPNKRPTKDGWNTVIHRYDDGTDQWCDLMLHDDLVIRYLGPSLGDGIAIYKGAKMDFVRASRIEKYALAPRYKLVKTGNIFNVWEQGAPLAHTMTDEPVSYYQPVMPMPDLLALDATGAITSPAPPARARVGRTQRAMMLRPVITKYVKEYMELLKAGMSATEDELKWCAGCAAVDPINNRNPLGAMMNDPEHLFAHLFEPLYPPGLVVGAVQSSIGSRSVQDYLPMSAAAVMHVDPAHEAWVQAVLDRYLKNWVNI